MGRFVEGEDRLQSLLLPETLDDYVTEGNPVRLVEVFIEELDLEALGFEGVHPAATGRPAYHPSTLLKIYLLIGSRPAAALNGRPSAMSSWSG
jgi:transposase